MSANDPHGPMPVHSAGAPLAAARIAMVMIHGRGASADSILTLAPALATVPGAEEVAFLAPQAAGGTWYPYGFMSPTHMNEPGITSGMRKIEHVLETIAAVGIPPARTLLLGFSQGACLATEFVARHARRFGGVAGLSGGLIGPDGTPRDYPGSLDGTPIFLGCSDVDFHIPKERVQETADVLARLGGAVDMRLYPGMGHLVNGDEVDAVRALLAGVLSA